MVREEEWISDRLGSYPEGFLDNLPEACFYCKYAFLGREDEHREMGFVEPLADNAAETTDIDLETVSPLLSDDLKKELEFRSRNLYVPLYTYRVDVDPIISCQRRLFCFPQIFDQCLEQLNLFWSANERDYSPWEENIYIPGWYCVCESVWAHLLVWFDIYDESEWQKIEDFYVNLHQGNCQWKRYPTGF